MFAACTSAKCSDSTVPVCSSATGACEISCGSEVHSSGQHCYHEAFTANQQRALYEIAGKLVASGHTSCVAPKITSCSASTTCTATGCGTFSVEMSSGRNVVGGMTITQTSLDALPTHIGMLTSLSTVFDLA